MTRDDSSHENLLSQLLVILGVPAEVAGLILPSNQTTEVCQGALADGLEESERVLTMLDTLMDISEAETGVMTLNLERASLPVLMNPAQSR